jgi:hypothetical protein
MNNFETLVAITSAMRSTNVERLAITLAEVNPKDLKVIKVTPMTLKSSSLLNFKSL